MSSFIYRSNTKRQPFFIVAAIITVAVCMVQHKVFAASKWFSAYEVVARGTYSADLDSDHLGFLYSTGLDARKVFSGKRRNVATANVQLDIWCTDNQTTRAPIFEHDRDCEGLARNLSLNFHVTGDGKFNFLVGHTELPFGLEVPVTTSKSLRTLLTPRDLALKVDWGFGVNGTFSGLSYAAVLSRGSGLEYRHKNDPWAFSGRIGTYTNRQRLLPDPGFGLSLFRGDVLLGNGTISQRERIALDGSAYRGKFGFLGQLSYGDTDDRDTWNGLMELNFANSDESRIGYIQIKGFNEKFPDAWRRDIKLTGGFRQGFTEGFTWGIEYSRRFRSFTSNDDQNFIEFQLKYRWE